MAYEHREGQGSLFKNEKQNDRQPDYRGTILIGGVTYEVAAWERTSQRGSQYLSLQASLPRERTGQNGAQGYGSYSAPMSGAQAPGSAAPNAPAYGAATSGAASLNAPAYGAASSGAARPGQPFNAPGINTPASSGQWSDGDIPAPSLDDMPVGDEFGDDLPF